MKVKTGVRVVRINYPIGLPNRQIVAVTPDREFVSVSVDYYPAGEPFIKEIPEEITALIVRPRDIETLVTALFLLDATADHGYPPIDLILPYFPGGRQDRVNDKGDLLFTARSVAKLVNNTGNINTVKILDPHSDVVPALLRQWPQEVKVYDSTFAWGPERDASGLDYDGVIAPDAGSVKRATAMAELLKVKQLLHGWKHRDFTTGEITEFGLEPPKTSGHFLVVDDICDGGGTFLGLAKEFPLHQITADLFVTHGVFSSPGNLHMLKGRYHEIYCSDSVVIHDDIKASVKIIPTVERML